MSFQLRAEEVVSAFVERIKAVNPVVNAVVDQRFGEAMQEARDLDARLDAGEAALLELPLLGVPLTVKESIALKGTLRLREAGTRMCRASKTQNLAQPKPTRPKPTLNRL